MVKTKADYYDWLMKKHDAVSQQLRAILKYHWTFKLNPHN